jgi:hypothetical protein
VGEGDGVAEGFELPDVAAGLAVFVGAAGVVAGAEVAVAGGGVYEQVPDDHQDGARDGDEGLELAAALHDPPVALAEEGVSFSRGGRGLAEGALEVGIAPARLAGAVLRPGLDGAGRQPRPGCQVPGRREDGHVQADLGDDDLRGVPRDAGDAVQAVDRRQHGRIAAGAGAGTGRPVGVHAAGGGDRGDQRLNAGGEGVDLHGEGVVLAEQDPGQLGVMGVEPAGQGLHQRGVLDSHPAPGQAGQYLRVALSGDQRPDHRPAGLAHDVGGHRRQLDQGVFQQLLDPLGMPGPVPGQVQPQPGVIPQLADLGRRDETGPQHAPLGQFRLPHAVELVRLGTAGDVLHVPGIDQLDIQASRFQQVVERPPVVGGRLERDLLDPQAGQVLAQLQDRVRGGIDVPDLRLAPARPGGMRHPGAHHPGRLGHVDRGDPLQDLLVLLVVDLLRLAHHRHHAPHATGGTGLKDARGPRSGNRKSEPRARSNSA